jgi:hypothetical protein
MFFCRIHVVGYRQLFRGWGTVGEEDAYGVVQVWIARWHVSFFGGPPMLTYSTRTYSIASWIIRNRFGSAGSIIPSNCTIRATISASTNRPTSIRTIRLHMCRIIQLNQTNRDISTTRPKSILQQQLPTKIQQLHRRLVILNTDIPTSVSSPTSYRFAIALISWWTS